MTSPSCCWPTDAGRLARSDRLVPLVYDDLRRAARVQLRRRAGTCRSTRPLWCTRPICGLSTNIARLAEPRPLPGGLGDGDAGNPGRPRARTPAGQARRRRAARTDRRRERRRGTRRRAMLLLDDALTKLAGEDERLVRLVECRHLPASPSRKPPRRSDVAANGAARLVEAAAWLRQDPWLADRSLLRIPGAWICCAAGRRSSVEQALSSSPPPAPVRRRAAGKDAGLLALVNAVLAERIPADRLPRAGRGA